MEVNTIQDHKWQEFSEVNMMSQNNNKKQYKKQKISKKKIKLIKINSKKHNKSKISIMVKTQDLGDRN